VSGTAQQAKSHGLRDSTVASEISDKQIVLVTGGSRGIGRALADEFASHGYALGLVARHADELEGTAEELRRKHAVRVQCYAFDLTALNAADRLRAAVEADGVRVKYLINNAGAWCAGSVAETELEELEHVIATNALVPLRLTKALLPHLAANEGGVLNVGSLAGSLPTPTFAVYGASKAFLASLSISMREELKEQGIPVCVVLPGLVRTTFTSSGPRSIWYRFSASAPETVAYAAYRGFMTGQSKVVPGLLSRVLYFGIRVLPSAITQGILNTVTAWRRD